MLNQKVLPRLRGTGEIKTEWTNAPLFNMD
jgi:hypothetical protein